jgi:PA14 domain
MGINVSNFFTPEFNNESAIAPWNASLEPTKAIIPQLDANRILTGGVGEEVSLPTLTPEAYDNIILPDDLLTRMASTVSIDSNTSLPDSSIDLLTGEAMSEVYGDLSKFAADPDFAAKMNVAFGENWDAAGAKALAEGWFQGDFSDIPPVKVVSSAEIDGANGAFAGATDTIYLSKEFLARNAANPAAVADVLLEEIGHSVDSRLNITDSPGDEGAIFGAIVQGKELSEGELQGLKSEDDTATVLLDGHQYLVEKQLSSFPIQGSIGSFYNRNPAIANQLGRATGAEFQFSPTKWRQNFQGGAIFHSANGTFSVRGSLGSYYLNTLGGQNSQLGLPTSEESYVGNWRQSFEKGTLEWLNNGTAKVTLTTQQTQVPANNWKAEYFNNRDLTGTPVFVENLGDGSQGFSRNWGTAAPNNNTPPDNFSARMTTQRSLAPGLYQIKVQADDGVKVKVGNQSVIDRWFDQPFVTNSGYFRSNGGTVPITVDYYERSGSAAINFSITPATKFRDSVDYTQQWKSTVYSWNSSQGSAPPTNFWEGDINSPNAIGEINLGSNTRSDGKKGINVNWGQGAPNGDGNRLPHNFFAMRAFTQADFDGSPYKFRVQGDDGFQLLAINQSTGQQYDITPANRSNQWTQAYSATEFTSQLPAGRYYMHFHQYEGGGDARFDLSWEKMGNPKLDIQLVYPYGGFTNAQRAIFEQAAQNWESVITKDKVPSGVLKIAITQGSKNILGNNWKSDIAAETYSASPEEPPNTRYDLTPNLDGQNQTHFNSTYINGFSKNNLIRLTMHEMGHALGLNEAQNDPSLFDTRRDSLMDLNSPANGGQDMTITEGMNKKLEYFGYGVNRSPSINWS